MSTTLPDEICSLLTNQDYSGAADSLALANLPFGEVFRLISNCVPAIRAYLHKRSGMLGGTPASKQITCHLYLLVALLSLSSMKSEQDSQSQPNPKTAYGREVVRIKEFLAVHKPHLNRRVVMRFISESGESAQFTREALVAFQDYEGLVDHLLSSASYENAANYVLNLPSLPQRQVLRLVQIRKGPLPDFIADLPKMTMDALFDTFAELALTAPLLAKELLGPAETSFEALLNGKQFSQPSHLHLYFIFMALLAKSASLQRFMDSPDFAMVDADFIASFLARRRMFALIAEVYARVPNRHILGVANAMKDSFAKTLSLLQTVLKAAFDARDCWLYVLRKCGDPASEPAGCDWPRLIAAAHESRHVTLDDIFPLVPQRMELDSMHVIIAQAVQASSDEMKQSNQTRKKIEDRAEQQRGVANSEATRPIPIDPSAVCYICGQSACDSEFMAFPCKHLVHIACAPPNPAHGFEDRTEELRQSCPACGTASLRILDVPFVYGDDEMWEVPE
jgi:hypothetical protein